MYNSMINGMAMDLMDEYKTRANDPYMFSLIPPHRQTYDLATKMVYWRWQNIKHVRQDLLNEDICLIAINRNWEAIEFIPPHFQTEEIVEIAVENNWEALRYIEKPSEELCLKVIKEDVRALQVIKQPTAEMLMIALEKDPEAIAFFK